jgi:hypothetical protein
MVIIKRKYGILKRTSKKTGLAVPRARTERKYPGTADLLLNLEKGVFV